MSSNNKKELQMPKQIYRFGHANANCMRLLTKSKGYDEKKVKNASIKVQSEFSIFASSGRPTRK